MENEKHQLVDLYIPRRCMATNKLIASDDHGSIQLMIPKVFFISEIQKRLMQMDYWNAELRKFL